MSNKILKPSGKVDKKPAFRLEKDFSINNVEHVKAEIDEIAEKNQSFHIDFKGLECFDLSAIQLIHSLGKKLQDKFSYTIEIKDELKAIIKNSGFEYLLNK